MAERTRIQLRKYVADHYNARILTLSPNARRRYSSQLKKHILPRLGALMLDKIDEPRAQGYISELLKHNLAPTTAVSCARLLLRVMSVADDQGFLTCRVDPRRIQWPRTQAAPRESRCFTAEEVERILTNATGWPRVLFWILAWSGLRIGEALGLDWSHIDWHARMFHIRQQASLGQLRVLKSNTSRADLPIHWRLHQVLADFWAEEGWPAQGLLFGHHGEPRTAQGVSHHHLTPLLERLGIPHAGHHAFRHSFCRALWAAPGANAETIRRLMRHSNLNQTLRYSHVAADGLRTLLDRVSTSTSEVLSTSPPAAPRNSGVTQPGKPT